MHCVHVLLAQRQHQTFRRHKYTNECVLIKASTAVLYTSKLWNLLANSILEYSIQKTRSMVSGQSWQDL